MNEHVHYLPIGLGFQHYVRPLAQDEQLPVDRAVLLEPTDVETPAPVEEARTFLEDELGIEVKERHVETEDFAHVVAAGYDDIERELDQRNRVYVNAASSPWGLGTGYATAASYVVDEGEDLGTADRPENPREYVSVYYTEPEEYHVDDLLKMARLAQALSEKFQHVGEIAGDLRDDVESDKQAVQTVVGMLELQDTEDGSLADAHQMFAQFLPEEMSETKKAFRDIFEGIESVTDGVNTLVRSEPQETLTPLTMITGGGGITEVISGLQELGERPREEGKVTPADMFRYFGERLDKVNEVLRRVEDGYDDLEADFEDPIDEVTDELEDIESTGVASGFRTFDGSAYVELPQPVEFGLTPAQRAILYTLADGGPTESVQELCLRVASTALSFSESFDVDVSSHPAVEELRSGGAAASDPLVSDNVFPKIKSKIQYELDNLVDMGFVQKSRVGRAVSVEFTTAGQAYATARSNGDSWNRDAFEGICDLTVEGIEQFEGSN